MTRRYFLDLDGTLVDPRRRLYGLFRELAPEYALSFEEYWRAKRNKMGQREMLRRHCGYSDVQADVFKERWMEKIEEPQRLATDVPFPGVQSFLEQASRMANLYLITARQYPDRLATQIRQLGWQSYFTDIAATRQRQSKAELIRSRTFWTPDDIMVGDTGEDIFAGKELGMRTVAVTSGALDETALREFSPDTILGSVVMLTEPLPAQREETAK